MKIPAFAPALLLSLLAVLGLGCADAALTAGAFGDDDDDGGRVAGQTILFVGTDPTTLRQDLYVARAVGADEDVLEDFASADSFEVEALTSFEVRGDNSPVEDDGESLGSDEAPFPVPDRFGQRIAMLVSGEDGDGLSIGRLALFDVGTRLVEVGPEVPGLSSVRFSWMGDWLVLDVPNESGRTVNILPADDLSADLVDVGAAIGMPGAALELAELERDGNALLLVARSSDGTAVVRYDPDAAEATALHTEADGLGQATRSAGGRWLAWVTTGADDGVRRIWLMDLDAAEPTPQPLIAGEGRDCTWPTWTPQSVEGDRLAFVCSSLETSRPDIGVWEPDGEGNGVDALLTATGQPALPGGSMDDQRVRSRPQWDPTGSRLVFGASTEEAFLDGEGMSLLVLPLDGLVYSVFDGGAGSVGWAHFSSATDSGDLLLWDRRHSGLQDSGGAYPIRVVSTTAAGGATVAVSLGRDLLVSHPMYLGHNAMLYP